jgi:hypothetical protein
MNNINTLRVMQETSIVRKIIFITVSFVLGRVTNSILPVISGEQMLLAKKILEHTLK